VRGQRSPFRGQTDLQTVIRLRRSVVAVMQTAKSRVRNDATRGYSASSAAGRFLAQPQMGSVFRVVADIFREQPFQMAFVNCDEVIQQFAAAAAYPTLCDSILPGTFERGADRTHHQGSNRCGDFQSILGITIQDDEPRSRSKWKCFSQLLDDPQACRMLCDVEVQDAPTIVADDEEAVEHTERNRWPGEDVHRRNRFPMVSKEGEPTFGRVRISRRSAHPARDRSLGEIKTEQEEFSVYPRRSPGWILGNHPENQISNLFREPSPPCRLSGPGDQAPIETEACPMPSNHRLRRDDNQSFFPGGPEPVGNDPEEFVEAAQHRSRVATLQYGELLPEREVFQYEMPTTAKRASKRSQPEKKQI
jgi:hypothetical protein